MHLGVFATVVAVVAGLLTPASTDPPVPPEIPVSTDPPAPTDAPGETTVGVSETWTWPASGVLQVKGRGYGHGRGMSQWGAYGAAASGRSHSQILQHYYPGTALHTRSNHQIRVRITGDDDHETRVAATPRLTARSEHGVATLPVSLAGSPVTLWRVLRAPTGLVVSGYSGGAWRAVRLGGRSTHVGPVTFASPDGAVRLALDSVYRQYRGRVQAVAVGAAPGLRTRVLTSVESYLRSVVPSEMPASWHVNALRAQAVAARTYAAWEEGQYGDGWFDTCDSTSCQVFKGVADYAAGGGLVARHEHERTDGAVAATAGRVLLYGGGAAFTQFSASNGGWSVAGAAPYLRAFADRYDGVLPSSAHSWSGAVASSTLQRAYPRIGTLRALRITHRTGDGEWGGRIVRAVLQGSAGSVTVSGEDLRFAAGLRSSWWAPIGGGTHDWSGDGNADLLGRRASDGSLWLYPGRGTATGGFGPERRIGQGWGVMSALVVPGDWDGDGRVDLLARRASDGSLWLYPGARGGGFGTSRQIGRGWGVMNAIVGPGDWDGDGRMDVVARRRDGTLWLYPGASGSGFGTPRRIGQGWQVMSSIVGPGDWDGDGRVDLLARRASDGSLWLYPGARGGGFGTSRRIGRGWGVMNAIVGPGDWNGDGRMDVVARRRDGTLWLYPGASGSGFGTPRRIGQGWGVMDAMP